jgi:hypothetical protein
MQKNTCAIVLNKTPFESNIHYMQVIPFNELLFCLLTLIYYTSYSNREPIGYKAKSHIIVHHRFVELLLLTRVLIFMHVVVHRQKWHQFHNTKTRQLFKLQSILVYWKHFHLLSLKNKQLPELLLIKNTYFINPKTSLLLLLAPMGIYKTNSNNHSHQIRRFFNFTFKFYHMLSQLHFNSSLFYVMGSIT